MTIAAEASNGSGRQPYDVRKIVDQIRRPRPDIQLVAAHRGLRWNGVAENVSRDADEYNLQLEQGGYCSGSRSWTGVHRSRHTDDQRRSCG